MKFLLPLAFGALLLAGCGSSSSDGDSAGTPPASLSGSSAEPKKGGSQATTAPAMQPAPNGQALRPPLEAGSALKGK